MRRITLAACTLAAAYAASREVHKLRAAQSACTLNFTRGPEPTKRFVRRAEAKGAGLVTSFRNAHAPQIMIHGSKPISATIGNYNAVYRVLKGTPHEWMLERHLEPKQS